MIDVSGLVQWMGENDKLAGWAQAVGAGLALVVAIGVPWWQHHREQRARKMEALQLEFYLASNLVYLVGDVQLLCQWIVRLMEMGKIELGLVSRSLGLTFDDVLERMRAHEARDLNVERRIILAKVRDHVFNALSAHDILNREDGQFSQSFRHMEHLRDSSEAVLLQAKVIRNRIALRIDLANTFILFRPILLLMLNTAIGKRIIEKLDQARDRAEAKAVESVKPK